MQSLDAPPNYWRRVSFCLMTLEDFATEFSAPISNVIRTSLDFTAGPAVSGVGPYREFVTVRLIKRMTRSGCV